MPFLIEDLTPRELRVPGGPATGHPNGASGIFRLEIAVPDAQEAASSLATLIGAPDDCSTSVQLGACSLSPVGAEREDAAHRLETSRPGPLAVDLSRKKSGGTRALHRDLAHGVEIRLAPQSSEG